MKILKSKSGRVILPAFFLCLFFLALIWVSYLRQRSFDKKDSIRFAVEKNSNLAVALEQYAIRTLRNADAILKMIRMEYKDGDSLNLNDLLLHNSSNQDIIEGVSIIGYDGRLRKTNIISSNKTIADFSDRPYFIFHSRNNIDSLLISKPLVSKLEDKTVIVLSRRINDAKGKFSGVVALQIQPSVFTAFYAHAKLLPNDIISLIAPDGITYARRTGTKESFGEDIHKSPLFVHVAEHADSFYFAPDAIRGILTWFSYRKLKDYPIIATVGSSQADILSDFISRQPRFIIPRIIISVLVVLFSFISGWFLLRRNNLLDRLALEKEK